MAPGPVVPSTSTLAPPGSDITACSIIASRPPRIRVWRAVRPEDDRIPLYSPRLESATDESWGIGGYRPSGEVSVMGSDFAIFEFDVGAGTRGKYLGQRRMP